MEYVFYIVLVLVLFGYWTFSDYWEAKAKMLHEEARRLELENDVREYGTHEEAD